MATGTRIASSRSQMDDGEKIGLVANDPCSIILPEAGFTDKFKLEIYRSRRRIEELECLARDKDERISRAIAMLEDCALMWRRVLHDDVKETYGGIRRRMIKIDSALSYLKDLQPHVFPRLEIPDRWKKKVP